MMLLGCESGSGREKLIDALLPDDRLSTVLATIRQVLGASWTTQESWAIEPLAPLANAA